MLSNRVCGLLTQKPFQVIFKTKHLLNSKVDYGLQSFIFIFLFAMNIGNFYFLLRSRYRIYLLQCQSDCLLKFSKSIRLLNKQTFVLCTYQYICLYISQRCALDVSRLEATNSVFMKAEKANMTFNKSISDFSRDYDPFSVNFFFLCLFFIIHFFFYSFCV